MSFVIPNQPLVATEEGQWTEYNGSRFKVAYATNNRFVRAKQRMEQPHRRKIELGTFDPVEQKAILTKAMSEGILLDWDDVKDEDGNKVPYSKAMAEKAMKHDETFREFIMEFSVNIQNFQEVERETSGNV